MAQPLCSRCHKNPAVIPITKIENGVTSHEILCLNCARELGIKPVGEFIEKLGLTEEDLQSITTDMAEMLGNPSELMPLAMQEIRELSAQEENDEGNDENDDGKTATFPFLNRLFSQNDLTQNGGRPARESRENGETRSEGREKKSKFLESYCISLTRKAREGKLDRIVGREGEIARVVQILNRRQKNNPCLIGEPGVGKTAIAEGLAQRIADGDAPVKLRDKEVYLLDLTALVAGTQFRGQFESRMKGLIEDIRKLGNIVLVIDEVHNLVGAGDAEGSMNAANILKPALSRGEIQVIGATTFAEYRKHIEKDAALERRFQPVVVNEPSIEESVGILMGIAHYYETFHGVIITPEVARQAVLLSERYITDRYLPDKAIDLIDEACSDVNLHSPEIAEREMLARKLDEIQAERDALMTDTSTSAYERLAVLRSQELVHSARLAELDKNSVPKLTAAHLAVVIEQWTKIPASRIQENEYLRLSGLEERLREKLIGQDEAVSSVAAAIRRGRVGISPKHKPISFIFVGPTGVGKTELVKRLAADLFDSPESLIRLDMSEFMEKHAVSRIIGAPPGYVGYDEAGQLTEKIRRKPYCVILLDEIEKAHPDVLNIFLQILDDGHITDAHGRTVNFENTVIIMTSNAGSHNAAGSVGFGRSAAEQTSERALKALQDVMRPEFINRVDEIVSFRPLSEQDFTVIAGIMLDELADSLRERSLTFSYSEALVGWLVKSSFSGKFGARNLRRAIQKEVEDKLASALIGGYAAPPTHLKADVKDGKTVIFAL